MTTLAYLVSGTVFAFTRRKQVTEKSALTYSATSFLSKYVREIDIFTFEVD